MMRLRTSILAAVVGMTFSTRAFAQTLADRVPADALIYVGWRGTDSPGERYDASHLKAVIEASKIREFVNDFGPRLAKRVRDRQTSKQIQTAVDLIRPMLRYPTAVFFAGMSGEGSAMLPKIGVLCQAGADAPALQKTIEGITGAADEKISSRVVGDLVVLTFGYDDPNVVGGLDRMTTLRQRDNFAQALEPVKADKAWVVGYADVAGLFQLVGSQIGNKKESGQFTSILTATGVSGVKSVVYAAGLDGADWMSRTFVDAPSPRVGLMALCDGQTVSEATLKLIPADATFALAGHADFAKFVKETRVAVEKVDPEAGKMFDRGVGAVTMALGKQLIPDLLEPLGPDWAVYSSPSVAGTGLTGLVVVNKLDDAAKLKASLPQTSISLSNWLGVAMAQGGNKEMTIAGQSTKVDGRNVYYLGLPLVSPSWTIADDTLYAGLYTQSTIAGARRGAKVGPSILDNPKFAAVQKRLGVTKPSSVSFYDLPTSVAYGAMYQQLMVFTNYAGFADLFGVPIAQPLLPPFDVILANVTPAGSASWTDDKGFHAMSVSPFPGSLAFTEQGSVATLGVGSGALVTSIMLPSLNRGRETANRVKCASNMRTIGQGILLYANENRFKYPPDLGTLILTQELTAHVFLCPSSNSSLPADLNTMTPQQIATWVNENSDYVYIGQGLNTSVRADRPVLYEKPGAHDGDGMNILFGDGHVEFQPRAQAEETINNALKPDDGGL